VTKTNELTILDRAITELGPQSYLGPWLSSVRHDVIANIRGDLEPTMLPSEALRQAADIMRAANDVAAETTATAQQQAAALIGKAHDDVTTIRWHASRQLDAARMQLGRV
jgi:hypothetical protein